jgi:riboflavin kinase/FMN adenylyltransferase
MTAVLGDKFGGDERIIALDWRSAPPAWARQGVVAVGNFDGVHRGHAALIGQASNLALAVNGPVVAITFNPHPLQLLAPERFQPALTTADDRAHLLRAARVDAVAVLKTDAELLNLSPEAFFQEVLIQRFQAKGIVEGFNFRFGHDRAGSVDLLRELCERSGIPFRVVEPFALGATTVSSSKVRDALMAGDVSGARTLLGRSYSLRGIVGTGAKRGRTIGFPTANLEHVETIVPRQGVYAVTVLVHGVGIKFDGAANVGPNPTFGENARKLEVHLLDFSGDLYGQSLTVWFHQRLRDTRRFNGPAELVEQMNRDVEEVRRLLPRV